MERRLLLSMEGTIEAPLHLVAPLVLSVPETTTSLRVIPSHDTVATQGRWWYRDETRVQDLDGDTVVTRDIYDVSKSMTWMVPAAARTPLRLAPRAFADRLAEVADTLGVDWHA